MVTNIMVNIVINAILIVMSLNMKNIVSIVPNPVIPYIKADSLQ